MDGAVGAGLGLQVDRNVFCFSPGCHRAKHKQCMVYSRIIIDAKT